MLKVGVIGFGYWGPNIVRNLTVLRETTVKTVCDVSSDATARAKAMYPHLTVCQDYREVTHDPEIEAVAVVTPVSTHYEIARHALENGKHVFVEKPFTASVSEAEKLIKLAKKNKLIIMVDHTFLFTGAVRKIKEVIDDNTLGSLYYYDATRFSLGLVQQDINVIWDLAPHDFSILDHVIKDKPVALTASGIGHLQKDQETIAYITFLFERNFIAHIGVNWLSPVKIRTTMIGGQKKMLLWNDLDAEEKIKIYDKGVKIASKEGIYRMLVDYRMGDMISPRVDQTEALKIELIYFAQCIRDYETPINDGEAGLRVVKLLEAADRSLRSGGKLVKL